MASQPIWRAFLVKMAQDGAEDQAFDMLSDGDSVLKIARKFGVGRTTMYRWFVFTAEREARYKKCQDTGGDARVDRIEEIADAPLDPMASPQEIAHRKLQVDTKRWAAGVAKPALADKSGNSTNITINANVLHLDALRQRGGPDAAPALPAPRRTTELLEAEIITKEGL